MKREQFRITSTEGHNIVKSAWNSSNRAIEKLAKELAIRDETYYCKSGSQSVKDGFYFTSGTREWTNQNTGATVLFTIAKES